MITAAVIDEMKMAKKRYEGAITRGSGVKAEKERVKNLLYNYLDDIIALSEENATLTSENENLLKKVSLYERMMNEANTSKKNKKAASSEPAEE